MRRMIPQKQIEGLENLNKGITVNEDNITITVDDVPLEIKYQPISINFFDEEFNDFSFNLPEILLNIENFGYGNAMVNPVSIKPHILTAEEIQGINAKHSNCTVDFPCYTSDINVKIYNTNGGVYTFFGKKAMEDESSGFYPSEDEKWTNLGEGSFLWVEFENVPAFGQDI